MKRLICPKFGVWRPGQVPILHYDTMVHGSSMGFTDTTSRSPTARRIRICRWIWATIFDVLAAGWRRRQEDDRELERRRRRYPNLCESSFYACISIRTDPETEDRSILCCRRNLGLGVRAGPQAKLPGHLSVLPRKHLSDPRRFE